MNTRMTIRTTGGATMIVTAIWLGSCGGTEDASPAAASRPTRIKIARANVGGSYFPMGSAIAKVLSTKVPGLLATDEASGGSSQNIRMLDRRQIDFGLSNASITFPAIRGLAADGSRRVTVSPPGNHRHRRG